MNEKKRKRPLMGSGGFAVLMVAGYFISALIILSNFPYLDMSAIQLLKLFSLFLALSFLIPISLYRRRIALSYYEYLFFNFLCFAPFFIVITFQLNEIFKGNTYIESYQIIERKVGENQTIFTLQDQAYEEKEYMRTIKNDDNLEISGSDYYALYLSDGLLGIRIIEKKKIY